MKALLDTNLWIALTLDTHPGNPSAVAWHASAPLNRGSLLFCRHTEISFLRLTTQEATMQAFGKKPFSNTEAARFLASVQADPMVVTAQESPGTKELWLKLAASGVPSPKVWMDAYLAALAIQAGADLLTFDKGFRKFEKAGLSLHLLE
jgi:toxin-antitoxin system PIN domain toxin